MNVQHELIKKQRKTGKSHLQVTVDIFKHAEELYRELDAKGFVERMKSTPQLGAVRINKKYGKSRYDYMMLQLYFHGLVKKNLPNLLYLTYNNKVNPGELRTGLTWNKADSKVSIADLIQILTIITNIGHFRNTFISSRAMLMCAQNNPDFRDWIVKQSADPQYRKCAEKILDSGGYKRIHLLNALLVIEHCDQNKFSVQIAKELLIAYINENEYAPDSKIRYVFWLFRAVRNVAFIAYDLQVSSLPLVLDMSDPKALLLLLKEHLSAYSGSHSTEALIRSLGKMLDDNMYNRENHVISHYEISRKMVSRLNGTYSWRSKALYECLGDENSPMNQSYPQTITYDTEGMLRLTFGRGRDWKQICAERSCCSGIVAELERMRGVRVGYYDRNGTDQTIIVSVSKKNPHKAQTAFRVMRTVVKHMRRVSGISRTDPRYLLTAKFFLFYLADQNPVLIKQTISDDFCVSCAKGFKQNLRGIKELISKSDAKPDTIHEAEFLSKIMTEQTGKDLCLSICGSIQVFKKEAPAKNFCEFDGMLLYPNRKNGQIVFLEAKNKNEKPGTGKRELGEKLLKLRIPFEDGAIKIDGFDAYCVYNLEDLVQS